MDALHFLTALLQTGIYLVEIRRDERGVSALEYALIASGIGLVIIVGVRLFGVNLNDFFNRIATTASSL